MICEGMSMVIENASVVLPYGVLPKASVKLVDGVISDVSTSRLNGCSKRLDARGMYVLPGLVDLHSDAIEKEIEPRPGAFFPVNMALFEMDKKLAACGITTMYHSLSYDALDEGVRKNGVVSEIVREVNRLAPRLGVRTRVHARFEIANSQAVTCLEQLIVEGNVHLFSITDHTPGQGQYKELASFLKISSLARDLDEASIAGIVARLRQAAVPLQTDYVRELVGLCHTLGIPVASHDDDTLEKLDIVQEMGIRISEFPINMDTAVSAAARGMHICYGSPNVVRGLSTGGNLSARDAIAAGLGDILCSDYAPTSLIHAVFTLKRSGMPLHAAVNMASRNPAKAAGISSYTGSIETGKMADLIIVDTDEEIPQVRKTFVEGREVYSKW